jgi:cell division protein ZapE
MAAVLVPPRQFDTASFDSYRPDPDHPSQAATLQTVREFAVSWAAPKQSGFFGRSRKTPATKAGIYLDGGFGVGKTHLLAALWHAAPGPKYFGTFIEFTALVGALGYAETVKLLTGAKLIAIDEFELDDPGDTMMMTRLLGDLVSTGSKLAATSNTPPNALGEGRFAAQDFLREIQALADRFEIIRIDGLDYRRRDIEGHAKSLSPDDLASAVGTLESHGARFTVDSFEQMVAFLGSLHPSKYIKLLDDLDALVITDVVELHNQTDALRLVAFIDRVYDAQLPIYASGVPLDEVFAGDMLNGGYRKKYLRSASRLIASTQY